MSLLLVALVALAACPDDSAETGAEGTVGTSNTTTGGPTTVTITTSIDSGVDVTGGPGECLDDYDGNHDLASAHSLALDTTDTARAVLGDQVIGGVGNEQGSDRLVVCPGAPDFFAVGPQCPGYMGIDLRRIDGGAIDLHLYANGVEVDSAVGTWNGFFLKPLHLPVTPQDYAVEVRHASGGEQAYSMEVYVLPTAPCP